MPELTTSTASGAPQFAPQLLCASADLVEGGKAVCFEVLHWGRAAAAFALRVDGQVSAYLNRCAHVPVEMDWQPGEFLDSERRWIVCSIHGATYDPHNGHCVGGPCGRGRLTPIRVLESDGQLHWYPSEDIHPLVV